MIRGWVGGGWGEELEGIERNNLGHGVDALSWIHFPMWCAFRACASAPCSIVCTLYECQLTTGCRQVS